MIKRPGNYWHMLPQYGQARKVIWDAVNPKTGLKRIDDVFPPTIVSRKNEQQMQIELVNGSIWQLVGSDNYNSIVGAPPVGIVMSEWALANPLSWAYLSPILEENKGWVLWIYTSRGNNHGRLMYEHAMESPGWYADRQTAEQTDVFDADQLGRIKDEMCKLQGFDTGIALYNQEYLCAWDGPVPGAYLSRELDLAEQQGRITDVPPMAGIEVDTFWDLGVDDSTSIWYMQPSGQSYRFIDYDEATGYGLPHYAQILKSKPYTYGNHWMPHDANAREISNSDVAKSIREVAEDLGIRPVLIAQRARNMDMIIHNHIPAMRNVLSQCWFDKKKCERGLSALRNYRSEYDEDKQVQGPRPVHDWSSHGADAFRTFAVGYSDRRKPILKLKTPDYTRYGDSGWML